MSEVVNCAVLSNLTELADEVNKLADIFSAYPYGNIEGQGLATEMKDVAVLVESQKLSLAEAIRELEEALAAKEAKKGKTDE